MREVEQFKISRFHPVIQLFWWQPAHAPCMVSRAVQMVSSVNNWTKLKTQLTELTNVDTRR